MTVSPPTPRHSFRPEIQALRALAVGIVVLYHVFPRTLPGGFIGVDVFFVISGFLITGNMLREVRERGRLSLSRFWANRARRILPASLLAIAVVSLASLLFLPITDWPRVAQQALSSVFYVQNWTLAAESVDYLASTNIATPFQHFWTLAVEEQFYLFWPLLVVLAVVLARRWFGGRRAFTAAVATIFMVVVLASFVASVSMVNAGDAAAYFVTTSRVWELGAGALLALAPDAIARWRGVQKALTWTGIATIAAGAFLLSGGSPFPGALALVPVLGAALVVLGGRTSGVGSLRSIVDLPAVQWLGDVSYSLYLWHFPPVVFFLAVAGARPTHAQGFALIALGVVLAAASYYVVERPTRRSGWLKRSNPRALGLALGAMVMVGACTFVLPAAAGAAKTDWARRAAQIHVHPGSGFGAEALRASGYRTFVTAQPAIVPNPLAPVAGFVDPSTNFDANACSATAMEIKTPSCLTGAARSKMVVALVGDSHARQWLPPLEVVAKRQGWGIKTYLHDSCPFSAESRVIEAQNKSRCHAANEATLRDLLRTKPSAVIVSSWAYGSFVDSKTGRTPGAKGYATYWNALTDAGITVVVVKDAPRPRKTQAACVATNYSSPDRCGVPRAWATTMLGVFDDAAELAPKTHLVDLTDRFCTSTWCPAVAGGVAVYRDTNHIGTEYSLSLEPDFARALVPAIQPAHPSGHSALAGGAQPSGR